MHRPMLKTLVRWSLPEVEQWRSMPLGPWHEDHLNRGEQLKDLVQSVGAVRGSTRKSNGGELINAMAKS